jgi:N-succinyl-L-ornithine transcarbamylase
MKHFTTVKDIPDLKKAVETALDIKKNRFGYQHLGKNKTMVLIFFNPSLRTRLSTQKAAMNLGMNTMVMNVSEDGWQLESELGVVMDGDKPEHLKEAIPVIGKYCEVIGCSAPLLNLRTKRTIMPKRF